MKYILTTILGLLLFAGVINAQVVERSVEAIETLQTGISFIYQGVDIPVLDISYHEWSTDSVTWSKTYTEGDCYLRISNDVKTTWVGLNVCAEGGAGTSQIDTVIICSNGVCDTITTGTVTVNIPAPRTITGSTTNLQTDTTHTHELTLYMGEIENVDTTSIANGKVLKWNETLGKWVIADDLIGGGAAGYLTVKEQDGAPDVSNVNEIRISNGNLIDEGAGAVSIDFTLEAVDGAQDFFRTDTVEVNGGDTFLTFSTPLPATDYIVTNAYALYSNGERQNLSYDSIATDGFRVLGVLDTSEVHYLVMRNLDSLGLAVTDQGRVLASGSDTNLDYLAGKTDDTTIIVTNNELTVLKAPTADSVPEDNVYVNTDATLSKTSQDRAAFVFSPFIDLGADITDLGNDSIAISEATAYMKIENLDYGAMKGFTIPADTIHVPTDANYTVYIDYNAGSPIFKIKIATPGYFYQNWDEMLFSTVVNLGHRIIVRDFKDESTNAVYKILLGQANYQPIRMLGDGITVTDQGTRQFSTSIGAGLFGNAYHLVMPIDVSATDTFTRMYYNGGWNRVLGEQTVNNTHYNDTATGLVALGTGYYTNKWLYYIDDAPSFWIVLDGQFEYSTYSSAFSVTEPEFLPPELSAFYAGAVLVGKFVVQEGRTEFAKIQNPFLANYGVHKEPLAKSYSFTSQGVGAGTYFAGGFYDFSDVDANLTQASTTQAYGGANASYAAHAFLVAGGAGTVDAGQVGLRVTGTRIEDNGTRTAGYADTIITDITTMSTNDYVEGVKFIGTITYELIVISGTPTTYSFDFNYGFAKYEDFGNVDFEVSGFESVGVAGATDADFNITLIHHNNQEWTYAATGFDITPTAIVDLQTVHNTEYELLNGSPFAFKVTPVTYPSTINGSSSEGVLIRIVTNANNSVQSMDIHMIAREIE